MKKYRKISNNIKVFIAKIYCQHKMISLTRLYNNGTYRGNYSPCSENKIKKELQIQSIFFGSKSFFALLHVYVSTRSRIRSSCASSHRQTIITSRRFCRGGSSTALSDDKDDNDDGNDGDDDRDDDENDERARRRLPRWLMSEDVRDKVRVTPLPVRLN